MSCARATDEMLIELAARGGLDLLWCRFLSEPGRVFSPLNQQRHSMSLSSARPSVLSQDTEIKLLAAMLPYVRPTFVDVGAERGAFARFLAGHGLRGTLFEPLPQHQASLDAIGREHGTRHFPFAIDEKDGKAQFHIACDEKGQPLNFFHSLQKLENDPRVHHTQSWPVVCRSLASLQAEGLVDSELGVLKIDTEGNDLRVLRGLGPVHAEVMMCEFFTPGIYNGWSEAEPLGLIEEARRQGFAHWLAVKRRQSAEIISLNPLAFGRQEWGNLLFLRDAVFQSAWPALSAIVAAAEEKLFSQLEAAPARRRGKWLRW